MNLARTEAAIRMLGGFTNMSPQRYVELFGESTDDEPFGERVHAGMIQLLAQGCQRQWCVADVMDLGWVFQEDGENPTRTTYRNPPQPLARGRWFPCVCLSLTTDVFLIQYVLCEGSLIAGTKTWSVHPHRFRHVSEQLYEDILGRRRNSIPLPILGPAVPAAPGVPTVQYDIAPAVFSPLAAGLAVHPITPRNGWREGTCAEGIYYWRIMHNADGSEEADPTSVRWAPPWVGYPGPAPEPDFPPELLALPAAPTLAPAHAQQAQPAAAAAGSSSSSSNSSSSSSSRRWGMPRFARDREGQPGPHIECIDSPDAIDHPPFCEWCGVRLRDHVIQRGPISRVCILATVATESHAHS